MSHNEKTTNNEIKVKKRYNSEKTRILLQIDQT